MARGGGNWGAEKWRGFGRVEGRRERVRFIICSVALILYFSTLTVWRFSRMISNRGKKSGCFYIFVILKLAQLAVEILKSNFMGPFRG